MNLFVNDDWCDWFWFVPWSFNWPTTKSIKHGLFFGVGLVPKKILRKGCLWIHIGQEHHDLDTKDQFDHTHNRETKIYGRWCFPNSAFLVSYGIYLLSIRQIDRDCLSVGK